MSQVDTTETETEMSAPVPSVLSMIDAIVMASDDDVVLQNVAIVRQRLGGERPSIVIEQAVIHEAESVRRLIRRNQELEAQISSPQSSPKTHGTTLKEGFYELKDFLNALLAYRGQSYAWRSELVKASETSPGVRIVKNEEIQRWQQTGQVPAWAYDQITKLVFQKRKGDNGPTWADIEYAFLKSLYLGTAQKEDGSLYETSSKTSNGEFASICSDKFGRNITENAIKGAIDRLRKRDELPKRRNQDVLEQAA